MWCRLEDIAYVAAGSTPDKSCFVPEGIPYIKMYNVRNQQIDFDYSPQYIIPSVHYGKLQRSILYPGDLLMNIVGPPLGKLAIIPDSLPESNTNQAAVLIRPFLYKGLINKYLFYYLEEMTEINSIATKGSAGQVNISLTQSQLMRIPLPPLEEQRKIVESIEKWIGLVDNIANGVKSILDNIENAKAKILELAIHGKLIPQDPSDEPAIELLRRINPAFKPSDNLHYEDSVPAGWILARLGDIVDFISGTSFQKTDMTTSGTGIKILRGGNIQNGHIVLCEDDVYISDALINERSNVKRGDIVIVASTGSSELIGKAALSLQDYPRTQIGAFLRIIRPQSVELSDYLGIIFQSELYKNHIREVAKGTNINNIKASYITEFTIPIPPLEEQKRIIKKVCYLSAILSSLNPE